MLLNLYFSYLRFFFCFLSYFVTLFIVINLRKFSYLIFSATFMSNEVNYVDKLLNLVID